MTTETHISLDLETLSTESNAAIVQIGAYCLNTQQDFSILIDPRSSENAGSHVSVETIEWWDKQPTELRKRVFSGTTPLQEALWTFRVWALSQTDSVHNLYLWSKGADFDCVVLKNAYELFMEYPFDWRNHRCVRTAMHLLGSDRCAKIKSAFDVNNPDFTPHDALWDAKLQAEYVGIILE